MASSMITRLRKLIDHQSSARAMGSIAEADAFSNKVQQLMLSHDVTMSELGYDFTEWHGPVKAEGSESAASAPTSSGKNPKWQDAFGKAIASQE